VWIVVLLPAVATLALGGALLFLVAPQWWWPRGGTTEQHWHLVEQLTGNGYVWFGAAVLVLASLGMVPARRQRDDSGAPPRTGPADLTTAEENRRSSSVSEFQEPHRLRNPAR
jgi:hypothetical protein